MTASDRLRQAVLSLAGILEAGPRAKILAALDDPDGDPVEVLEEIAQRLRVRDAEQAKLLGDRNLQLNLALDVLRTRDRMAAKQAEWDFAASLQYSGLPQDFPPFPDRREFDLHAGMVTAKEVGGDLYDFFLLAPERLGFVVADAAGKGLPAAIFITLTRTLLRAAAEKLEQPGECLRIVNAMLCIDNPSLMFTTAFYGVLDTQTGEIVYANAGHNPPYVLSAGGKVHALAGAGALALGVMEDALYPTQRAALAPGDTLVCYTDGVTEAVDASGALYGEPRLAAALACYAGEHPTEVLTAVVADVDAYIALTPMADDVTLLVVRYNGAKAGAATG
ncbi:MAG: PP2C family protein-serine/threonine phosphatase [Methylovirgula sp.]|nr:PP2C family protein-serine/threonine phosphatase [Methylovirgula sp.]